jgi:hypothetical protein
LRRSRRSIRFARDVARSLTAAAFEELVSASVNARPKARSSMSPPTSAFWTPTTPWSWSPGSSGPSGSGVFVGVSPVAGTMPAIGAVTTAASRTTTSAVSSRGMYPFRGGHSIAAWDRGRP